MLSPQQPKKNQKDKAITLRKVPEDVWKKVLERKQEIENATLRGDVSIPEALYSLIRKA